MLAATRQTASGIALWHIHLYCILLNFLGEESVAEEDKRSRTSDAIRDISLEGGLRGSTPQPLSVINKNEVEFSILFDTSISIVLY